MKRFTQFLSEQLQSDFIGWDYRVPSKMFTDKKDLNKAIHDFYILYYVFSKWPKTYSDVPLAVTVETYDRLTEILYAAIRTILPKMYEFLDAGFRYGILAHLHAVFNNITSDEFEVIMKRLGVYAQIKKYYADLIDIYVNEKVIGGSLAIEPVDEYVRNAANYAKSKNIEDLLIFGVGEIFNKPPSYDEASDYYSWGKTIAPRWGVVIREYEKFKKRRPKSSSLPNDFQTLFNFCVGIDMAFSVQHHNGSVITHTEAGEYVKLDEFLNKKVIQNPSRFLDFASIPERIGHLMFGVIGSRDQNALKMIQIQLDNDFDLISDAVDAGEVGYVKQIMDKGFDITKQNFLLMKKSMIKGDVRMFKVFLDKMTDFPRDFLRDTVRYIHRASENSASPEDITKILDMILTKFPIADYDDNILVLKSLVYSMEGLEVIWKHGGRLPQRHNKGNTVEILQTWYKNDLYTMFEKFTKITGMTEDELADYGAYGTDLW